MATDSSKQPVQPRDARIVSLILQSLGVEDYDPKVVHQLLQFAHRYTSDVFQDALVYSEHANKPELDLEDVQLAIQGRVNHSFTNPPPKEFLLELAQEKNKQPLPLIPEKYGIRLPADKHCLTGINFSIVPDAPSQSKPSVQHNTAKQDASSTAMAVDTPEAIAASQSSANTPVTSNNTNVTNASSITEPPAKRGRDALEDDNYDF